MTTSAISMQWASEIQESWVFSNDFHLFKIEAQSSYSDPSEYENGLVSWMLQ